MLVTLDIYKCIILMLLLLLILLLLVIRPLRCCYYFFLMCRYYSLYLSHVLFMVLFDSFFVLLLLLRLIISVILLLLLLLLLLLPTFPGHYFAQVYSRHLPAPTDLHFLHYPEHSPSGHPHRSAVLAPKIKVQRFKLFGSRTATTSTRKRIEKLGRGFKELPDSSSFLP